MSRKALLDVPGTLYHGTGDIEHTLSTGFNNFSHFHIIDKHAALYCSHHIPSKGLNFKIANSLNWFD